MYSIGQFAKKTGLTIRALRFYDEKDLLKPIFVSESGQRFYDDSSIVDVQKILVCKYLDYPLEQIKQLLQQDVPMIDALHAQKIELLEKKQQLEQMLASIDLAISIHEKTASVDTTSLFVVIHSMLTIDEQKAYLNNYLPEPLVTKMYDLLDQNLVEMNRRYIEYSLAIKQAYKEPLSDDALKDLFYKFFYIIPQDLLLEIATHLAKQNVETIDNWLFTSLFTEDEEQWIQEEIERLQLFEEFLT